MKAAFFIGIVGTFLAFWIGHIYLNCTVSRIIYALLDSNIAALISLLLVLYLERNKKLFNAFFTVVDPVAKTWGALVFFYFSILFLICPFLRCLRFFCFLSFPLILSVGFSILFFGPIQDWLNQKKK